MSPDSATVLWTNVSKKYTIQSYPLKVNKKLKSMGKKGSCFIYICYFLMSNLEIAII